MKEKIFLSFVILFSFLGKVNAQYQSFFGSQHTTWNMVDRVMDNYITDSLVYEKDTLINALQYKKVNWYFNIISGSQVRSSFFREDTTTGKLWHLCPGCASASDTVERLIIDMSLQIGDTFFIYQNTFGPYAHIVDSVFYYNSLKYIRLNIQFNPYYQFMFIESVGTNTYLGYNQFFGGEPILLCQYKDDGLSYMYPHTNPLFQGNCYININNISDLKQEDNEITIFPNPANESVQFLVDVNDKEEESILISITNLMGQKIHEIKSNVKKGKLIWDVSNVPNGNYIYQLRNGKKLISTGKLSILH